MIFDCGHFVFQVC